MKTAKEIIMTARMCEHREHTFIYEECIACIEDVIAQAMAEARAAAIEECARLIDGMHAHSRELLRLDPDSRYDEDANANAVAVETANQIAEAVRALASGEREGK